MNLNTPSIFAMLQDTNLQHNNPVLYDTLRRIVSALDATSTDTAKQSTIVGDVCPPVNVTALETTLVGPQVGGYGVLLTWNYQAGPCQGSSGIHFEIRLGANTVSTPTLLLPVTAWDAASFVGSTNTNSFLLPPLVAGFYTYLVKAVNGLGQYSTTEATVVFSIAAPVLHGVTGLTIGSYADLTWN